MISGHSPTDETAIFICSICLGRMKYRDIWVVEDDTFHYHKLRIDCCSERCGEMAILQNIQ
jgi:hypothetical protein